MQSTYYKIKSFYRITEYKSAVEKVENTGWFKTPIDKFGKDNQFMAEVRTYKIYDTKTTNAYKYSFDFYLYNYGKKSDVKVYGWTIPSTICGIDYSNRNGSIYYTQFSFECISPDGNKIDVRVRKAGKSIMENIWDTLYLLIQKDNYSKQFFERDDYPFFVW